jgi:hypothetical protein
MKMNFIIKRVIKKKIQSLIRLGLNVMFLKYDCKNHTITKIIKLLIPIGRPTMTSLNNPATKETYIT